MTSPTSSPETKKKYRIIKEINPFDKFYVAIGLMKQCELVSYINCGSFGRVYAAKLTKKVVLKAFKRTPQNQSFLKDLVTRMNIVYFNPSAHVVRVYKVRDDVKVNPQRVDIIMEKCSQTLREWLKLNTPEIITMQFLQENLRFIDQIIRGVLHLHRLRISIGILDLDKILLQIDESLKILKILLSSTKSKYSNKLQCRSSANIEQYPIQFADDLKMLVLIIIKLIWRKDFKINGELPSLQQIGKNKLDKDKFKYLSYLLQKGLEGKITCAQFHKEYSNNVYKPKRDELLEGASTIKTNSQKSYNQMPNSSQKIIQLSSKLVDATYELKTDKIDSIANQFQREYGKNCNAFLSVLNSILQDDIKK